MPIDRAHLRIGEVSRRTGVPVSTLRAWERRYDLLDPERTEGGHRLYRDTDVERVRAMQSLVDEGWSAVAAAREVLRGARVTNPPVPVVLPARPAEETDVTGPALTLRRQLEGAFRAYDTQAVNETLDAILARFEIEAALDLMIMPALDRTARGWETDAGAIAREHFASNALRPRLLRLLQLGSRSDRVCVAAAPETEEHDLGLLAASATASAAGWRVRFLGARTPRGALEDAVAELRPQVVLIATVLETHAKAFLASPPALGDAVPVLGGAGFSGQPVERLADAVYHEGSYRDLPALLHQLHRARRSRTG